MFNDSQWVWTDGEIVPWRDATVHVSAHALHYGTGVFEGIRCYAGEQGPAIFRLDAHLDRFFASAEVYGLRIPFSAGALADAACEVVRRNRFSACYIRPICFYGSAALGLLPSRCPVHVAILAWPWKHLHQGNPLDAGLRITVSRWRKFDSSMMPATAKACGQYLNSIIALREAVGGGYDEALLLDQQGSICEGSGENIFLVKDGTLFTNGQAHPILMGVTRDAVITLARDLGLRVEIGALRVEDLLAADEAFFTGTAAEVTPICQVDGRSVGAGAKGPLTARIQKAFFDAVYGRDARYRAWLHPVAAPSFAATEANREAYPGSASR